MNYPNQLQITLVIFSNLLRMPCATLMTGTCLVSIGSLLFIPGTTKFGCSQGHSFAFLFYGPFCVIPRAFCVHCVLCAFLYPTAFRNDHVWMLHIRAAFFVVCFFRHVLFAVGPNFVCDWSSYAFFCAMHAWQPTWIVILVPLANAEAHARPHHPVQVLKKFAKYLLLWPTRKLARQDALCESLGGSESEHLDRLEQKRRIGPQ